MAVTVEELQIVVVANVKNAMAQMTQLNRQIKKTMTDAVKPVKQVTESAQKSASVIAKAQAQIAEANARTQVAQDKMRASAAKTQAAIEKASAASAKAQESLRKSTEAANAAMERQRKATARVKQTREELAKIVDRALKPQKYEELDLNANRPAQQWSDVYADRYNEIREAAGVAPMPPTKPKAAPQPTPPAEPPKIQPSASGAQTLTVWQRVTAQINAKLDALKEKLHKVGLYGKDAGEKTEKALKKVRAPAENAARAVKKVGDSARKSSAHAGYLGRMLKSMAVSMLFFQGIAMLTNAVRDGIQNIAQGSTRANAVLSSLASSFLYLKNSIASAFMPALQALAPVIATITNALASMLNMIGAVTARLFGGATTFVKAKKVQTDYAASISKTGQAAKKAAKDAQGALASFDELNVIDQEKTADSGDAAGGVAQPAGMFETVAISPEALSFADKVAGMFDRLKTAAEPTIEAFGRLKTVMQPLKEFTFTALTDFYKNFLVPVGKWTLGEGLPRFIDALSNGLGKVNWGNINTALKTLWEALTPFTIHVGEGLLWFWENVLVPLGTWTMNNVVPLFLEILAAALRVVNAVIEALKPLGQWLFDNFLLPLAQWTGGVIVSVLKNVRDALNSIADWIQKNQKTVETVTIVIGSFAAAWTLANGAIGLWNTVAAIAAAVTKVLGTAIAFLTSPIGIAVVAIGALIAIGVLVARNWETIKQTAVNVWTAIRNFFTTTIPSIISDIVKWFSELPDKIAYAIGFVLGKIVLWASNVITTVKTEVPKIVSAVVLFFQELPGKIYTAAIAVKDKVITWAINVQQWFSVELPKVITAVVQFFKELPQKIYEGLTAFKDKVISIGKWLLDGIFEGLNKIREKISGWKDSFVKGFKDALGIHSPSTVMRDEVGVFIAAGIAQGIRDKLGMVTGAAKDVANAVQKVFNGITYSPNVDYMELMQKAEEAGDYSKAAELEKQRNAKISGEGLSYQTTDRYSEHMATTMDGVLSGVTDNVVAQQAANTQQNSFYTFNIDATNRIFGILNDAINVIKKVSEDMRRTISDSTAALRTAISEANLTIGRKLDILTAAVREVRINIVNNYITMGGNTPKLASGGVLRSETAFVGGEYAGASSNPEIVSPQSIMLETFKEAVWPLVDAILEGDEKVKSAIEAKDTNMYVDGYKMNRTLAAHDSRVSKQRGTSLVMG